MNEGDDPISTAQRLRGYFGAIADQLDDAEVMMRVKEVALVAVLSELQRAADAA